MIVPKAKVKELYCNIITKGTLPSKINCDIRRIFQVIFNLSQNGIKYTFKGGITITLWQNKSKSMFCIEIKDTGIGMASVELERINKLFGLLDRKLMHNETGIGLGLMVSKGIINKMGGVLKIYSKLGEGTVCKAKIPIGVSATLDEVRLIPLPVEFFNNRPNRPATG